jgi:hypothetical protein
MGLNPGRSMSRGGEIIQIVFYIEKIFSFVTLSVSEGSKLSYPEGMVQ